MKRLGLVVLAVLVAGAVVATATTLASDGGTEIDYDGDRLTLAPTADERVTGQTDLDPGTTLHVRLESAEPSQPFLLTQEATVAEDGSFAAAFDLRDVANSTANVSVLHDGSELATASAEIEPCEDDCEQESNGSDANETGTTVDYDGETLTLTAAPAQEITGESHLDAGTELRLRLESADVSNPFLLQETANVTEDGTFATTMDLAFIGDEANATLAVLQNGTELARTDVVVEPCDESCPEASSANENGFGLADTIVTAPQNETAEIPVTLDGADAATLRVGDEDVNYQVTATAEDGNGDGRVVFVVDPSAPGNETATVSVADSDDDVSIDSETDLDEAIDPAEYDLSLYRGASDDGDPDDIGTLVVLDP